MHFLDNPALFKKYDRHHVLDSIMALPNQCAQAWREASTIKLPASYRNPRNIVVAAMGGSALGAHIIRSVFDQVLTVPYEIVNHYQLPASVNSSTLTILISYSGGTEETLTVASDAKRRKAKIIGITLGGALGTWLQKNRLPAYIFNPRYNPSGQPRLGTGYTMIGTIAFLTRLVGQQSTIKQSSPAFLKEGIRILERAQVQYGPIAPTMRNRAKQIAQTLQDKGILLFASEHLVGNAHTAANQINESAKQFTAWFAIPEANHHFMEGLTFPKLNPRYLAALFLRSTLYHPRVSMRYSLTKEVLAKQRIPSYEWGPRSKTRFNQALEALSFGSFLSFYLAIANRIDPSQIPWVDYFKKRLT